MSLFGMPMNMALHPTLDNILDDFIHEEIVLVFHEAAELEVALKLYQAQMSCFIVLCILFYRSLYFVVNQIK